MTRENDFVQLCTLKVDIFYQILILSKIFLRVIYQSSEELRLRHKMKALSLRPLKLILRQNESIRCGDGFVRDEIERG